MVADSASFWQQVHYAMACFQLSSEDALHQQQMKLICTCCCKPMPPWTDISQLPFLYEHEMRQGLGNALLRDAQVSPSGVTTV